MKIVLSINYVNFTSGIKKKLQNTAISVVSANSPKNVSLVSFNFTDEMPQSPSRFMVFQTLQRDSKILLGNNRRLPYIKDFMDICAKLPCDVFGYMNSDILITKKFFNVFNHKYDAYVFYKKDIESVSATDFIGGKYKVLDETPAGVDAFFFHKKWWLENRNFFPNDLVLGESEWDTCYNSIIQKVSSNYYMGRDLYHVVHDRIWNLDSRGAINNMLIWQQIKKTYGLPQYTPESRAK